MTSLPVLTVVVARVSLGALALWVVVLLSRQAIPRNGTVWRAFFVMGFLNNVIPFSLMVWGQIHIASALAAILNATTPIFMLLVAHGFTADERLTPVKTLGVLLGFAGVATMLGGATFAGGGVAVVAQFAVLAGGRSDAVAGSSGGRSGV